MSVQRIGIYVGACVVLVLLIMSKRYREKLHETSRALSEANDTVETSLRRLDAIHNGGKPKLRVL